MYEEHYQLVLEEEIESTARHVRKLEEELGRAMAYKEATENALQIFKSLRLAQDVEV